MNVCAALQNPQTNKQTKRQTNKQTNKLKQNQGLLNYSGVDSLAFYHGLTHPPNKSTYKQTNKKILQTLQTEKNKQTMLQTLHTKGNQKRVVQTFHTQKPQTKQFYKRCISRKFTRVARGVTGTNCLSWMPLQRAETRDTTNLRNLSSRPQQTRLQRALESTLRHLMRAVGCHQPFENEPPSPPYQGRAPLVRLSF